MRKVAVLFALVSLVVVFSQPVFAQTASSEAANALSIDDAEKLRQQMKALAELLKSSVPEDTQQRIGVQQNKTVAEVLDKALDLVSGSVATIAAGVEKAAPHVWRIMIRQQYANAFGNILLPSLLLVLCIVYYRLISKRWNEPEKEVSDKITNHEAWYFFSRILPIFSGVVFGIWTAVNLTDSLKIFINPEYYAIKDLITMVLQNNPM